MDKDCMICNGIQNKINMKLKHLKKIFEDKLPDKIRGRIFPDTTRQPNTHRGFILGTTIL